MKDTHLSLFIIPLLPRPPPPLWSNSSWLYRWPHLHLSSLPAKVTEVPSQPAYSPAPYRYLQELQYIVQSISNSQGIPPFQRWYYSPKKHAAWYHREEDGSPGTHSKESLLWDDSGPWCKSPQQGACQTCTRRQFILYLRGKSRMGTWMLHPQKDQLQLQILSLISWAMPLLPASPLQLFPPSLHTNCAVIRLLEKWKKMSICLRCCMWYQQQTSEMVLLNSNLMTQCVSFAGAAYKSIDKGLLTGERELKGFPKSPPSMSSNSQRQHPWSSLSRFQAARPGSYPQAVLYRSDNPGEWAWEL